MLFTIIPWQVDVPQDRLPLANWLIIAVIIGFFAWQINQVHTYHTTIEDELSFNSIKQNDSFKIKTDLFKGLVLKGWNRKEILGHIWLHGGWMHVIGNLFFLWIFGNAVCAKIGQFKFVFIYLLLGVAAGAAHLIFSGGAAIGASGAIYGVMGMYLVFFPTNSISCLFVMLFPYYIKTFEVASYAIIILRIMYDIIGAAAGGGHIAYYAHLGGFTAGVIAASLLLLTRLVKMKQYEISLYQMFTPREKPKPQKPLYERVLARDYAGSDDVQIKQEISDNSNDGFIRVYCQCGMRCKIPSQFAGKTGKCPRCKQPVQIPLS